MTATHELSDLEWIAESLTRLLADENAALAELNPFCEMAFFHRGERSGLIFALDLVNGRLDLARVCEGERIDTLAEATLEAAQIRKEVSA